MSDPYLGEIRMFGGTYAPVGWAMCNGSLLSVAQNDALFTLFATTYGGDGQSTFGLPNLLGRVPIHDGTGQGRSPYVLGQLGGAESVTLAPAHHPPHTHTFSATTDVAKLTALKGNILGAPPDTSIYYQGLPIRDMGNDSINLSAGMNQPHENRMPSLAITFIVALQGIFPARP